MPLPSFMQPNNTLLQALPAHSFNLLAGHFEAVDLPLRFKLSEPGRDCAWVYFPSSGVASVLGPVGRGWQEIGLFGQEGAGCLSTLIGAKRPTYLIVMQVAGRGWRIPFRVLEQSFRQDEGVRQVLLRYLHVFLIQVAQSSIANAQYNTVHRMAHWFLMIHDRVEGDSICLTHEYIAALLGVGRTGITLALQTLERSGVISTARKRITILDRGRLERMTASVYGFAEAEYQKLIGPMQPRFPGRPAGSEPALPA